jgi:Skp family chaperone for outer membrane proteins
VIAAGMVGGMLAAPRGADAQGATATSATTRLATVDVFAVVERVWLSDTNMAARTALAEVTNKELEALNAKMGEMRTKAEGLGPDSPELKTLAEQFQQVQAEAQQKQQQGNTEMERVSTLQLGDAYQQVMLEAQKLAKELGYTHVLASKLGDLTFRSTTMNGALQELLARPVVVGTPEDDITERLMAKFPMPAALSAPAAAPPPVSLPDPAATPAVPTGQPK